MTPTYTLADLTRSQVATRRGIDNTPPPEAAASLERLRLQVLEPLAEECRRRGLPVPQVTSGYRAPAVNAAVGGSPTSQHVRGEAADLVLPGHPAETLYQLLRTVGLPFDQLIQEFDSWVHVSWAARRRQSCLRAVRVGSTTRYLPDPLP